MRASCSRWMRIDLNSEGTWDPLKTFGPEGVGQSWLWVLRSLLQGWVGREEAESGGPARSWRICRRCCFPFPGTTHVPWQLSWRGDAGQG